MNEFPLTQVYMDFGKQNVKPQFTFYKKREKKVEKHFRVTG